MKPLPDRFRDENLFFSSNIRPKNGWKSIFHHQISKTSLWPPSESIDLEISHLLVVWIPLYDQIWPIWWRKRVKKQSQVKKTCKKSVTMKVSNGLRQLPRVYRVFPMVSKDPRGSSKVSEGSQTVSPTLHASQEGLRWCPKVPRLCPLRCIHVKKKVITAWREKLMTDECWLLIDHWSLMIDD